MPFQGCRVQSDMRALSVSTALLLVARLATAQVLVGTVQDSASGNPIAGARILLLDSSGTAMTALVTHDDGQFTFLIPHLGQYRLLIARIGYPITTSIPFSFPSAFTAHVSLSVPSKPIVLDTVTVITSEAARTIRFLMDAGFYRRRNEGFGHFLTRDEIDKRDPQVLTDLLRNMSGVRVSCRPGFLLCDAETRAASSMFFRGNCRPSVVLDGVLLRAGGVGNKGDMTLDQLIGPFNVEALEVYPGPEGVPVQYSGYLSPCGAILIWSRR